MAGLNPHAGEGGLFGEEELQHLGFGDEAGRRFVDRPPVRRGEAVGLAQRGEAAPGREPAGLLLAETVERGVLFQDHGASTRGELQGGSQLVPEATIVGPSVAAAAQRGDFLGREQPAGAEVREVEQVRVAGEHGERLVGRIAVAGRAERTDLPPGESGRGDDIDEPPGFGAERAYGTGAGQRGRVQQDAGATAREGVAGERLGVVSLRRGA